MPAAYGRSFSWDACFQYVWLGKSLGEERVVVNIKLHCFDTGALAYCIDQRVIIQFFELPAEFFLYSAIMPSSTPNEKKTTTTAINRPLTKFYVK